MPEAATAAVGFNWAEIIGQFGLYGILAWYLYYNTSIAIPNLMKNHEENHKRLTEANNATIREVVGAFDQRMQKFDDSKQRELENYRNSLKCQAFAPVKKPEA